MVLQTQLKLNPSYCETFCISYKCSPSPANYRLNNHVLSTKSVVWYLGIFINSHLRWPDHVKHTYIRITTKAAKSLNVLQHSLYTCSNLPSTNALFVPYWSMVLQCGTCTHLVTSSSWRVPNVGLPDGSVEIKGILSTSIGLSHLTIA